ncbi:hypothetical protein, partial [Actibacterium sp.]|uniref:hypothetical protein n=1 Tax=Actibacterium sp. TaxID=1872125 RepID=UPI003569EC2A
MAKTGLILTNQVNPAQSAQLAALPGIARVITPPADQPLWQIPPETDILYTMPKDAWKDAPETAPPGWPGKLRLVHTISAGIDGLPRWLMDAPLMSRGRGTTAGPNAEYVMVALLEGDKRLGAALSTTGTTGDAAIA